MCSRLAVQLGMATADGFRFSTDVGVISGRLVGDESEIDLQPAHGLQPDARIALEPGEKRIGFIDTGVPHLVVLVDDADQVNVNRRGAELRHHSSLSAGANVNFLAPIGSRWRMRTYERGVEGETLACGTGSVACAVLLEAWGLTVSPVELLTTSGRILTVTVRHAGSDLLPSLKGEGRLVYSGVIGDL